MYKMKQQYLPHVIILKSKLTNVNKTLSPYVVLSKGPLMLVPSHSLQNPTCLSKYKKFLFKPDPIVKHNLKPEGG